MHFQAEGEGPAAALDSKCMRAMIFSRIPCLVYIDEHMYLSRPNTMTSPHVVTPLT